MKYQKEYEIQRALGTLPIFIVERKDCKYVHRENDLFSLVDKKGSKTWLLKAITKAISPIDAIDRIIKKYNFSEEARQHLHAYRYIVGHDKDNDAWINGDDD
jgi:hypothetical protein